MAVLTSSEPNFKKVGKRCKYSSDLHLPRQQRDGFVKELREALEGQRLTVWVDSRDLRSGAKLALEIEKAIELERLVS
jgi:hypothetical protein